MRRTKANSRSRTLGAGFGSNRHTTAAGTTNHRLSCKKQMAASKHFCKCHNHNSRQLSHRLSLHQTNATVIGLRTCLADQMPRDGDPNADQRMRARNSGGTAEAGREHKVLASGRRHGKSGQRVGRTTLSRWAVWKWLVPRQEHPEVRNVTANGRVRGRRRWRRGRARCRWRLVT